MKRPLQKLLRSNAQSLIGVLALSALAFTDDIAAAEETPFFTSDVSLYANHDGIFYRLPSLIVTSRGTVLAAAQKRLGNGGDFAVSSLVLRRSHDAGQTFEPEQPLFEHAGDCTFNGNLVEDRSTGVIFAFFIAFPEVAQGAWFAKDWIPQKGGFSYVKSTDDGKTWSGPVHVMPLPNSAGWYGGGAFNNNHGIQLHDGPHAGRLVIAGRVFKPGVLEVRDKGGLIYSDDHGATWRVGGVMLMHCGSINGEVTIGEAPGGEVYVNSRNEVGRALKTMTPAAISTLPTGIVPQRRIYSRSRDGGESFYEEGCHDELFDGPCNAGQTAVTAADGNGQPQVMLFTAPAVKERTRLTGYVSRDGGRTWQSGGIISDKAGGYSDDAAMPDGTVLTVYENGHLDLQPKGLLLARFSLSGLAARR